jgi:hypothetical protein
VTEQAFQSIHGVLDRAVGAIHELEVFIQDDLTKNGPTSSTSRPKVVYRNWLSKETKVKPIRGSIKEARENLVTVLASTSM